MTVCLECAGCGKRLMMVGVRRTFTSYAIPAYEKGWRLLEGRWFCGEDCVANAALDVTPKPKLIPRAQ